MIRRNLHAGLLVQLLALFLFIPAVIIISRPNNSINTATSSVPMAEMSFYPQQNNNNNIVTSASLENTMPVNSIPPEGPGGPILVISSHTNPFTSYIGELLRAEGLNEFAVKDITTITPGVLTHYDVVLLGEMKVDDEQVKMLSGWVHNGGVFIAFKPCSSLNSLLGIASATGTLSDKYLMIKTDTGPGAGIVSETMQFHGTADLHELNGATSIATLYKSDIDDSNFPAVTTINVGTRGGKAITFLYDLARSVVYTRQGNPAWAGQKRDGQINPIRSDDLFFPNWIDFKKVAIPQADEQQRFLANIILQGNLHQKPLPRFWYLPRDLKAVIVMTGDNHTNNGTTTRFYQYLTLGPNTAQDVSDWKAVRATSYIYPDRPINNEQAVFFEEQGFEISLHTNTGCYDYTSLSLQKDFSEQLNRFAGSYPGVAKPITNRSHCLNWSDWSSTPKVELQNGIRLDATYYYWPQDWMQNRPGMFTGSGIPMRFADLDGSIIDVYQVPTQMTDETNMDYSSFCNTILDKALGPEGYYGVFCANMHTDNKATSGSDAIIASAQARQVPVISARQMLTWLDARNNSSFGNISWQKNRLDFSIYARSEANHLKAMLPITTGKAELLSLNSNGKIIPFTIQTIKGMEYAFFAPSPGFNTYTATYSDRKQRTPQYAATKDMLPTENIYVNPMPNPSMKYFNMVISSNDAKPVAIKVSDVSGHIVETRENVAATGIIQLGHDWKAGTYFAEVAQGNKKQLVKLTKVN